MKIANSTILITGASRGIGEALVNEALRRGACADLGGHARPPSPPAPAT